MKARASPLARRIASSVKARTRVLRTDSSTLFREVVNSRTPITSFSFPWQRWQAILPTATCWEWLKYTWSGRLWIFTHSTGLVFALGAHTSPGLPPKPAYSHNFLISAVPFTSLPLPS